MREEVCGLESPYSGQSGKAREIQKDEREKWKWWKGSWGWGRGEEETEKGEEGRVGDEKGKGKEIRWEIKKRGEIKWSMWFKAKGTAKRTHPYEKPQEGQRLADRKSMPSCQFSASADKPIIQPHTFSSRVCIFDRTSNDKLTTTHLFFFFPLCFFFVFFIVDRCNPSEQTPSWPQNTSVVSVSLNTHLAPTNTMVKNTVVVYHWFIQRHTSEINGPLGAVTATLRAVIIKSFGMVKIQYTHTVEAVGQHSGRNKWCGSGYFWNELNEMQSRLWIHTCFDRPVLLRALEWTLGSYSGVKSSGNKLTKWSFTAHSPSWLCSGYLLYVFTLSKHIVYYSHSIHIT